VARLPTGTVTFLFTDLEGSTGLAHRLGEDFSDVLVDHRTILRTAVAETGGREIDCRGDEFFLAFERTESAVEAAVAAQRKLANHSWPSDAHVRVRMGMHTGTAVVADEDYLGLEVHRAARICFAGHGGQILMSKQTRDLLPEAGEHKDLGEHRLRGLPAPEHIFQVVAPGLPDEFPPLRSTSESAPDGQQVLRVVLADDSVILREGIARILEDAGCEVVGQCDDAEDLLVQVGSELPDIAVIDIRMPPTHTDDGLRAAKTIRRRHPETAVLVLSQYAEPAYARELLEDGAERVGYLLKDRVSDIAGFAAAVRRVAGGGSVLDPEVVTYLMGR
jgi:class 3 adenylate cyclase/ActR/RegA family two-component response regulator